jgi:hypothetical protein
LSIVGEALGEAVKQPGFGGSTYRSRATTTVASVRLDMSETPLASTSWRLVPRAAVVTFLAVLLLGGTVALLGTAGHHSASPTSSADSTAGSTLPAITRRTEHGATTLTTIPTGMLAGAAPLD